MQTTQRVIVVHSPHSGRSSKLSEALTYLEQAGLEIVNTISIADLDNLPAQGPGWKESGIDIAIAAGGDGLVGGDTGGSSSHRTGRRAASRCRRSTTCSASSTSGHKTPIWSVTVTSCSRKAWILCARVDHWCKCPVCAYSDQCSDTPAIRPYDVPLCRAGDIGISRCTRYRARIYWTGNATERNCNSSTSVS